MSASVLSWWPSGEDLANGALAALAAALEKLFDDVVAAMATAWLSVDVMPPSLRAAVENIQSSRDFAWIIGISTVLCLLISGARLAWERRAEPLRRMLSSLLTLSIVSAGGVSFIWTATAATNELAKSLATAGSGDEGFRANVNATFTLVPLTSEPLALSLLASIWILVTCVQIIMLFLRTAVLLVLMVVFPIAAACSSTEAGRSWFAKVCGWLIAFLLYKPAAALIYLIAFTVIGTPQPAESGLDPLLTALYGITLMTLSVLALPALLRLCVPLSAAVAGGGGGTAMPGIDPSGAAPLRGTPPGAPAVPPGELPGPDAPSGSQPTPGSVPAGSVPSPVGQAVGQPAGQAAGRQAGSAPGPAATSPAGAHGLTGGVATAGEAAVGAASGGVFTAVRASAQLASQAVGAATSTATGMVEGLNQGGPDGSR